jgi:hypothetical protein
MGSDVRRVPDKNMERNDIFSLSGVPIFILWPCVSLCLDDCGVCFAAWVTTVVKNSTPGKGHDRL